MRIVETLTKLHRGNYSFRVWRRAEVADVTLFSIRNRSEFEQIVEYGPDYDPVTMAEKLAELEGVSAVQVENDKGDGFAIFPDWP